jgi:hypothetical protein
MNYNVGYIRFNNSQSKSKSVEVDTLIWKQYHILESNSRRMLVVYINLYV